jgi:hypothetical protein
MRPAFTSKQLTRYDGAVRSAQVLEREISGGESDNRKCDSESGKVFILGRFSTVNNRNNFYYKYWI